jgi:thiol-disulfide isomerase/thioredoxin
MNNDAPWLSENMMRVYTKRAAQLKSLLIGAKIPELVMADTSDLNYLSSYETGAKYTILWFWDPDCAHCVVETPKLVDFYHQYKDSIGVEVFAVSLDRDLERWKKYIREHHLDWINVGGEKANIDYTMVFDIVATPLIYVFDNQKRIIAKNIPVEKLKELFERYERLINDKH